MSATSAMASPPMKYWDSLNATFDPKVVRRVHELFDARVGEYEPKTLPPPLDTAIGVLERLAADGWLARSVRQRCPHCLMDLMQEECAYPTCPRCDVPFDEAGGPTQETVYVRQIAPTRDVDWVVAIHGMNTRGTWQEAFSWLLSTTWGRSVPVAIYKYGYVTAGVLSFWRRKGLQNGLREKLQMLTMEAARQGHTGRPDIIAHSFGTWLIGHVLCSELSRPPEQRIGFGRIILTGCILRPDFNWKALKDAGLVEEVLNHYGTKDAVVGWAEFIIPGSGPSGRRGFDGDQVHNVRAAGFGHSDLFSIEKYYVEGEAFSRDPQAGTGITHLENSYGSYWRPFLRLPASELETLPDQIGPYGIWRPYPWPLRATLLPVLAWPFLIGALAWVLAYIGMPLREILPSVCLIVLASLAGLACLFISGLAIRLTRYLQCAIRARE